MKRLLCIVNLMNAGGAETFLMKIYRNIDREKYQMDFITTVDLDGYYDDEIYSMKGKIFHMPHLRKKPFLSLYALYKCVRDYRYDNVLLVSDWSIYSILLFISKMAGVDKCSFRSTNTKTGRGKIGELCHILFKPLVNYVTDVKISPSMEAAHFMFGNNLASVHMINNGIDINSFRFNEKKRNDMRRSLGINETLIGHIGRMVMQKNHKFLLDIFCEYRKKHKAKLLLIGEGGLKDELINKAKELKIIDDIIFAGVRHDIPDLLMAMDTFLFPSLWEGLPNAVIEAQASGLSCIVSDKVTKECGVTDLVVFEKLSSVDNWVSKIETMLERNLDRRKYADIMRERKYDIQNSAKEFVEYVF